MLSKYRVLDLTDERGHLAAFILAQMGAEVIAIEPPSGSHARRLAPFSKVSTMVTTRCITGPTTAAKKALSWI